MFETHVDTLYLWVGLGIVSVAVLGVVVGLPTTAPPDATAAAATIDEVTTSPPGSVAHRRLVATEWAFDGREIRLRNDGGTATARLIRTAVPARTEQLQSVVDGTRPKAVYESPAAFHRDARQARTTDDGWRPAPDRVTVRHVAWGGTDVTIVG
ncbi:DUF7283 family protein [Haloarcula argentinensis]|uniref:Uncharacterized protein n=1 Tax=Haloarcula argentinensis TaxID=43776 RepID=A0A830FG82_HALAR|nr:hypothetical protein [Haloarcula argentinensis]EMA19295.1 hypothetical protein C443_16801 [Haloarcula argentinensis DSM 12282]MDS0254212.1 hypothetical protein [Haloarcula argentinensis]GGM43350.1 hypothetical protein GCM10009006_25800 [Haloarcula argentinensis]